MGSGERMTSRTKPVLPALAMTLAAAGICAAEKCKGQCETSRLCVLAIVGVDRGQTAAVPQQRASNKWMQISVFPSRVRCRFVYAVC